MRIGELMRPLAPLRVGDRLADAATRVAQAGGGLPVVDADERLAGYLSERDLMAALFPAYLRQLHHTEFLTRDLPSLERRAADAATRSVESAMSLAPAFVGADDSETHAAELFLHHDEPSLPVLDAERRVLGVLQMVDLVRHLLEASQRVGRPTSAPTSASAPAPA